MPRIRAHGGMLQKIGCKCVVPGIAAPPARPTSAAVLLNSPNHVTAQLTFDQRGGVIDLDSRLTDLVDVHVSWTCSRCRCRCGTPSPGGLIAAAAGIAAVEITWTPNATNARAALRRRLGLMRSSLTSFSGADGSGDIEQRARAIASADPMCSPL